MSCAVDCALRRFIERGTENFDARVGQRRRLGLIERIIDRLGDDGQRDLLARFVVGADGEMHLHLVLLGQRLVGGLVAVAAVLGDALRLAGEVGHAAQRPDLREERFDLVRRDHDDELGGDIAAGIVIQVRGENLRLEIVRRLPRLLERALDIGGEEREIVLLLEQVGGGLVEVLLARPAW